MRWQGKIYKDPVRSKGVPLSISGGKLYTETEREDGAEASLPGGIRRRRPRSGRANDTGVAPLWVVLGYAAPIEARTELIRLVHNGKMTQSIGRFPRRI